VVKSPTRVRTRFRLDSLDTFALLSAIGRDCVGAVQLVPAGTDPGTVRRIDAEPLAEPEVARLLRHVTSTNHPRDTTDNEELRISIAGAQEKTALLRRADQWYRPFGTTPTTHLLKLPLGNVGNLNADLRDSVENEWLCMQLLGELGLRVPPTEVVRFRDDRGEVKALAVERFDRQIALRCVTGAHSRSAPAYRTRSMPCNNWWPTRTRRSRDWKVDCPPTSRHSSGSGSRPACVRRSRDFSWASRGLRSARRFRIVIDRHAHQRT
jgi:hypothetical protein